MSSFDTSDYFYKAIIFDCDGTLVNSAPLHFSAFQTALRKQGVVIDHDWYMERLALSRVELITKFSETIKVDLDILRAAADSESQFMIRSGELAEITDVVDIARANYGKVPMAVASSGQKSSVNMMLENLSINYLFDSILTADDVSACKPDPEIYRLAADKLQIDTADCLVFEDTEEGLASAASAGAQFVDVRTFASIYTKKVPA